MKTVAFVPIRLNSKRVKNKNLREIQGVPLLKYILSSLRSVGNIDEVYVYCSDQAIKDLLPDGVNFLTRDSQLDGDYVKGEAIYRSFVNEVEADVYVLCHATSPFLKADSIEDAVAQVRTGDFDSAFSAHRIQTFCWYEQEPINYSLNDIPRTQDLEPIYEETSGFFIFKKELLLEKSRRIGDKPYIKELSFIESIDIDTEEDFEIAQAVANYYNLKEKYDV